MEIRYFLYFQVRESPAPLNIARKGSRKYRKDQSLAEINFFIQRTFRRMHEHRWSTVSCDHIRRNSARSNPILVKPENKLCVVAICSLSASPARLAKFVRLKLEDRHAARLKQHLTKQLETYIPIFSVLSESINVLHGHPNKTCNNCCSLVLRSSGPIV